MAVPAAPMPVHTAYAGPTSSFFRDIVSRPKLPSAKAQKAMVGQSRVKPCDSFRQTAKPVSSTPATMTSSHAMSCPPVVPTATAVPMPTGGLVRPRLRWTTTSCDDDLCDNDFVRLCLGLVPAWCDYALTGC